VGIFADKDAGGILEALGPLAARFVLTRAASDRAADPAALARLVPRDIPVTVVPSVAEALGLAEREAGASVVCVAGSLAVVGEAVAALGGGDKPCPIENEPASIDSLF
jgi:dihydrofolate synthase/folylpolyglutamate synthase